MPSAPESLATPFVDPWESTVVPIADFGFTAPITRWRTRSHTSNVCERSPRKNCGGSSPARQGPSQIRRPVLREIFELNEKRVLLAQNSAFWNTWVPCGRSAGITSHAVHLVRTVDTTGAVTTWRILIEDARFYKCWAGCTKEMIRAALGCPIHVRHSA